MIYGRDSSIFLAPDMLTPNNLIPNNHSTYHQDYSTETAILKLYDDMVNSAASRQIALSCLLSLSEAFNSVGYNILIQCLETSIRPVLLTLAFAMHTAL